MLKNSGKWVVQKKIFLNEINLDENFLINKNVKKELELEFDFDTKDVFKMIKDRNKNYPNQKILRLDRVNINGDILYPYSAKVKNNQWYIKVYELYSGKFSEILEDYFLKLKYATKKDFKNRKY